MKILGYNLQLAQIVLIGSLGLITLFETAWSDTTVRIRIVDEASSDITPAMVCITGKDGDVRLPPDGRRMENPSTTEEFYTGVHFDEDPNWIGPVRKTMGQGNNDDRSYVYGELPSIPYWREPVTYQTSGDFSIQLPDGKWRIAIERGMEYIPIFEEFIVQGQEEMVKEFQLKRWIDLPKRGWWSGDVHVHHPTVESGHREFLLQYAVAADLHIVNTLKMGHHKGTDFEQEGFGKEFRVKHGDYCLVSGQEDPRSSYGHMIGLNIKHMVRDLSAYDFYDVTTKGIHEHPGALVGFAHFSWNGCALPRGFPWFVTTGEVDFIELLQFSRINTLDYYEYLNLGFKLTAAAGSDTPWGSTIGEVRTYVKTGLELDIDAWFKGLENGNTFVSNGPALEFTVDGQLPGSEIPKKKGETITILAKVLGHEAVALPKTLTLVGNDGVIKEITNSDKESELTIELERTIDQSQWLVIGATCENGAIAHSTPIYIIVDGRPHWSATHGPAVIHKQLELIEVIHKEVTPTKNVFNRGIKNRLELAKQYYADLLAAMQE